MMKDGQWSLTLPGADAYVFGTGETPVWNRTTPVVGSTDIRTDDSDRPRADGVGMGVDFRGNVTVTFDFGVRAADEVTAREETERLGSLWRGDPVRRVSGAVAELRSRYAGRERVLFGRPRRYAPDLSLLTVSRMALVQADFVAVDDVFYSAAEDVAEFTLIPPTGGGLLAPLASPLATTASSSRAQAVRVNTDLPVWPVITLTGPILNPVVEVLGVFRVEARVSLAYDETLTIDTRPWMRSALRNGTVSVSGALRGTKLADAGIPAGTYAVTLSGTDATGTAAMRMAWRAGFSTP